MRLRETIAAYASGDAGTAADLDPDLERAGLEALHDENARPEAPRRAPERPAARRSGTARPGRRHR
jgi:hypothetical protein